MTYNNLRTAVCAITVALSLAVAAPRLFAASPSPSPKSSPKTSASPSPSPTASADATQVQQNIKDRIQQVIDQNKTTTGNDHRIKRALVGQIEKVNAESITIQTLHSAQNARIVDGNTVMLLMPSMQPLQAQDIELNAYAIAMGFVADDGVLDVRRLLLSPIPLFPLERRVILGILKTNTTKSLTVQSRDNQQVIVPLSIKTRFEDVDGNKATRTDFKADTNVLVSIDNPSNASSGAALVRVMK